MNTRLILAKSKLILIIFILCLLSVSIYGCNIPQTILDEKFIIEYLTKEGYNTEKLYDIEIPIEHSVDLIGINLELTDTQSATTNKDYQNGVTRYFEANDKAYIIICPNRIYNKVEPSKAIRIEELSIESLSEIYSFLRNIDNTNINVCTDAIFEDDTFLCVDYLYESINGMFINDGNNTGIFIGNINNTKIVYEYKLEVLLYPVNTTIEDLCAIEGIVFEKRNGCYWSHNLLKESLIRKGYSNVHNGVIGSINNLDVDSIQELNNSYALTDMQLEYSHPLEIASYFYYIDIQKKKFYIITTPNMPKDYNQINIDDLIEISEYELGTSLYNIIYQKSSITEASDLLCYINSGYLINIHLPTIIGLNESISYEYYYDSVDSIALSFNDSSMEIGYLDGKFYIYDTANEELLYPFDITIDEFIEL